MALNKVVLNKKLQACPFICSEEVIEQLTPFTLNGIVYSLQDRGRWRGVMVGGGGGGG